MKRVETIHINGIVFSIEDDAYSKLGSYLDTLGKYFETEQGCREIIADIEARIAELFAERDGGIRRVVTLEDVAKVIETLGTAEDIAGAETDFEAKTSSPPRSGRNEKPPKRLYRDPDHRYIGGVCAGIAAWLGISPLAVRLVFLFFAFFWGVSIGVYFLLWIIIPKAKTTAQKLEMRGEPVNISNIEKNIKESLSDPELKQSFHNFLDEAGEFAGKVFSIFGRIIGVILGLCLLCWGVCFAIALIALFFVQDIVFAHFVEWDFLSFTELYRHIISPSSYALLIICATIISTLLVFAFLYWGIRLITGTRVRHRVLHVSLFVLWIVAIVTAIMVCLAEARNFAWSNEQIVDTHPIVPKDTLYLSAKPLKLQISNNPMEIYFDKDNQCFYGKPNLHIRKSEDGQTTLRLFRESRGISKRAAWQFAENIVYSVDVRDSLLTFDPYFTVTPQDKWKFQTLNMTLYIPEGTVIIADNALCNDRIMRWHHWRDDECKWIMTEKKGLQRADKK